MTNVETRYLLISPEAVRNASHGFIEHGSQLIAVREAPTHGLSFDEFSGGKDRANRNRYQEGRERATSFLSAKERERVVLFDLTSKTSLRRWFYWGGYERGVETQFLLHRFWRQDSDDRWGKAIDSNYDLFHELGRGYRDGLQGLAHESDQTNPDAASHAELEK
jgi:hypothetical protein